jgi:hypothetical protein
MGDRLCPSHQCLGKTDIGCRHKFLLIHIKRNVYCGKSQILNISFIPRSGKLDTVGDKTRKSNCSFVGTNAGGDSR